MTTPWILGSVGLEKAVLSNIVPFLKLTMLVRVGFLEQLEGSQRLQVVLRFQDKTATKGKVTCQPGSCVCQGALPNSWIPMEIAAVILEAVPFPMVQVDQRATQKATAIYNKSKWSNGLRHDRRDPFVFGLVHSLVVRAPCIMTCIRVCMCAVSETSHEHDYHGCHGCCACHNYTVCVQTASTSKHAASMAYSKLLGFDKTHKLGNYYNNVTSKKKSAWSKEACEVFEQSLLASIINSQMQDLLDGGDGGSLAPHVTQ